jgi:hypothetical protein
MTAPRAVICRLCFETKALSELSRSASGDITDVCLVCREKELRAVLAQVEAILTTDDQFVDSKHPKNPDNEITVETVVVKHCYWCAHQIECWCGRCHYCEDVSDDE